MYVAARAPDALRHRPCIVCTATSRRPTPKRSRRCCAPDRALLALGFASAFRRSELLAPLAAAMITAGPVFRAVTQGVVVAATPLGDDGYIRMIKRGVARLGLDPAGFSGHSLRAGFLTSAAEAGASAKVSDARQTPANGRPTQASGAPYLSRIGEPLWRTAAGLLRA